MPLLFFSAIYLTHRSENTSFLPQSAFENFRVDIEVLCFRFFSDQIFEAANQACFQRQMYAVCTAIDS